MFLVYKEEAAALFKRFPDACITICSKRKRSGGKTYWCAEDSKYHMFINDLREQNKEEKENDL